jgi:hypothetical protein
MKLDLLERRQCGPELEIVVVDWHMKAPAIDPMKETIRGCPRDFLGGSSFIARLLETHDIDPRIQSDA